MVSGISSFTQRVNYAQGASRPSAQEMFTRIDTNGDGQIDQSELEAMLSQGPRMEQAPPAPPPEAKPPDASQLIERFDADGDGVLDEEEATAMAETLRAEIEEMMAHFIEEAQQSALLAEQTDDQSPSSSSLTMAVRSYSSTSASNTLTASLLNTLG